MTKLEQLAQALEAAHKASTSYLGLAREVAPYGWLINGSSAWGVMAAADIIGKLHTDRGTKMTKLEHVAQAIEVKSQYMISQHFAKALARAAVEALREPSEGMLNAGREYERYGPTTEISLDVWTAMHGAILNERAE